MQPPKPLKRPLVFRPVFSPGKARGAIIVPQVSRMWNGRLRPGQTVVNSPLGTVRFHRYRTVAPPSPLPTLTVVPLQGLQRYYGVSREGLRRG